jgi:hypothetical protein
MKRILAIKDSRLEALELKVQQHVSPSISFSLKIVNKYLGIDVKIKFKKNNLQEEKVTQLELALINSKSSPMKLNEISSTARSGIPRTCREAHLADPSLTSGMHWIDPDGQAVGDDPIYVYCDMISGIQTCFKIIFLK